MASFLLCAGSRGRRFALPHSRIMIHQPMGGAQGQAEDIRVEASQIMRIRNNLVKMYSLMTGQTTEQIVLDLDRFVHVLNSSEKVINQFLSNISETCLTVIKTNDNNTSILSF